MVINISFKVTGSKEFKVAVEPEITVLDLKKKCAELTDIPVDAQRLIFKGKILKDKENLTFYNVTDGSTMHLVRRIAPTQEQVTHENVNKPENLNTQTTPPAANNFNDMSSNPLFQMIMQSAGMGGMNNAGEGVNTGDNMGFSGFSDLMNAESGGLNRDLYQTIMNSPLTRTLMNELGNNPEMLSNVINNTEFLRNTLSQNPLMQQFFDNPDLLREAFNPELLQAGLRFENALNMNNNLNTTTNPSANVGAQTNTGTNTTSNTLPGSNQLPGGLNLEQLMNNLAAMTALRNNGNNTNVNTNNDAGNNAGTSVNASSNSNLGTLPRIPNLIPMIQSQEFYTALEQVLLANSNPGTPNMGNLNMGGMNLGMNPNTATVDTRPLEEVYESQLKSLQEMGFIDIAANIQALQETGGDINSAVTRLLERGYN